MSYRGKTAAAEGRDQYALGVEDGLKSRQGKCSDQHYQLGYRRGCARRERKQNEIQ